MRSIRSNAILTALVAMFATVVFGCGGGGGATNEVSPANQISAEAPPAVQISAEAPLTNQSPVALTPSSAPKLAVLVPDDAQLTDPRVAVWADTAWEEGVQLAFLTDSQFLSLGNTALQTYAGIVLPDSVHSRASDGLVQALTAYASAGGWLMLVYDFGALTANGFYAVPKSRLSDLAGVNYVLYDALLDHTIGLGPIGGTSTTLRSLQVPPGKSMATTALTTTTVSSKALTTTTLTAPAGVVTETATFLSPSASDPGGLRNYRHAAQFQVDPNGMQKVASTTSKALALASASVPTSTLATAAISAQEVISGYVYGPLTYPTYVTADASAYNGTILLRSTFGYQTATGTTTTSGVAAGQRKQGAGGVLFVNLPLSYLTGQTDGMLMHGFLRTFASQLKLARFSDHPNGRGGLVFNWHVDAAEALAPIQTLANSGVWDSGPFSIHFTAGPDTNAIGDGLGLNVPGNATTQSWIRYFAQRNHQIGSHGGWDHNLYGLNATEYNADTVVPGGSATDTFRNFLVLNKQAIESVIGRPVTEYSAPQGNNPIWAMDWLEDNNNVGYYFTGHTGTGPTRAYRPPLDNPVVGDMLNPAMWAFPVMPFGQYATFEEFQEYGVATADVNKWYAALTDFVVKNRTSRLVYAHPPGATSYVSVITTLLTRARTLNLSGQFQWYTMTDLAQFEAKRLRVNWAESATGSTRVFQASHPVSLLSFTWILPRASYTLPKVTSGTASVTSDASNWLVTATGGTSLTFTSTRLP